MTHVLILAAPPNSRALTPTLLARATEAAQATHPRILHPNEAAELTCPTPPNPTHIAQALAGHPIDHAILPAHDRRKRLLVADMDSTIVTGETLDELAAFAGVGERVAAITVRSMNGELDFAEALRERVALLQGLPLEALQKTWANVRLTSGAKTLVATMRAHGAHTALVSGGFTWFTSRVATLCGFDTHRANTLLDDGATLTGRVGTPILDRHAKLATLQELATRHALSLQDTLATGDGANDLDMIRAAGLGIAYHAKPIVAAEARAQIRHTDLRTILYYQGYASTEFAE